MGSASSPILSVNAQIYIFHNILQDEHLVVLERTGAVNLQISAERERGIATGNHHYHHDFDGVPKLAQAMTKYNFVVITVNITTITTTLISSSSTSSISSPSYLSSITRDEDCEGDLKCGLPDFISCVGPGFTESDRCCVRK